MDFGGPKVVTTLPETNSSPLKLGHPKIGNHRIPTIHFQVLCHVSFREGDIYGQCIGKYTIHLYHTLNTPKHHGKNEGFSTSNIRVITVITPSKTASKPPSRWYNGWVEPSNFVGTEGMNFTSGSVIKHYQRALGLYGGNGGTVPCHFLELAR